jgi:hypothetical protein
MNYESTIKKICEKRGADFSLLKYIVSILEKEGRSETYYLLGFLKSKETLIAVFGEDFWHFGWNQNDPSDVMHWGWFAPGVKFSIRDHAEMITGRPAWKHHGEVMGYTLDEVLKYYSEYLEVKE